MYVSYAGDEPASLTINGHRIVILSKDPEQLLQHLELLGGDRVCAVEEEGEDDEEALIKSLASTSHAHIVITPTEIDVEDILKTLERDLPWIQ